MTAPGSERTGSLSESWLERIRRLRLRYVWARLAHRRRFDEVRAFCLFIGYPRSGHSIVGAQLNAHRAAVIAHEGDAPFHILAGASRDELFARLLARAAWFKSRGHRSNYDYAIAHPWQGRFETLQVIGDKRGGAVTRALVEHPDLFARTRALVRVPLRLIHVVRNPYDNIAAIARWHALSLSDSIDFYFRHADAVAAAAARLDPAELHTLRHEDMIADPRRALTGLLRHLGLAEYPGYLEACAAAVFTAPTRTRRSAAWSAAERHAVEQRMRGRPFLDGYTFEEPPAPATHFPPPAAPPFISVPDLVCAAARRAPAAPAVVAADRTWTYAELEAAAQRVAAALQQAGLPRDAVIAVTGPRSFAVIAALLGVWLNRQVILPLADDLPRARLDHMLDAAGAALLLHAGPAPDLAFAGPRLALDHLPDAASAPAADPAPRAPADPAYIFFTSGTTGRPKGIRGTHGGLAHFLAWQRATFELAPADRIAQLTSLSFDVVLRDLFLALTSGASLCLPPPDLEPANPWPWFARAGITRLHAVPSLAALWLDQAPAPLPLLRTVFFAGEPLPAALVQRWRNAAGPGHAVINLYGPTETTLAKCWYRVPDPPPPGVQPVGQPLPETEVLVLDEAGTPCADGVAGELVIRTPHRTLGYLDASAAAGRGFAANPLTRDPDDLVYFTGDRGTRRADGLFEVHGRRDDQVKILGVRIEPAEIAAALLAHPAVRQAHVAARPGPPPRLVAHLAAAPGALDESALRTHLAGLLPTAMIPHQFVLLPQLPLTPNGKVDRAALPEPASARAAAPAGESARTLAAQWQAVLGGDPVPAGAHFFACGGDSLRAAQLVHRVRTQLGIALTLRDVFEYPVLEEQAARLARAAPCAGAASPVAKSADGPRALTAAQQRLWFMSRLAPDQGLHNLPGSIAIRGALDSARLEAALAALVARHPALRTRFLERDGQPYQVEAPAPAWPLEHLDLTAQPGELDARAHAFVHRPFDLTRAPLARALLVRLEPDEHVLVYAFHHAVADGWSNLRFNRALREACVAPPPQAPAPLPDLAAREAALLARHGEADRAYWQTQLAGAPARLALPADRPHPATPSYRRGSCARTVPPALVAQLERSVRAGGGTVFVHLLATLKLLLHQLSGARDLLVAVPVAGREDPALADALACLVNTVLVRTELRADDTAAAQRARVRAATLEALEHAALPFDHVVQAVRPARDPRWHPLSQVLFNHLELDDGITTAPGLCLEREWRVDAVTPFDLALYARQQGDRLQLHLVYNADLFAAARMEPWLAHFTDLLAATLRRPDAPLAELPPPPDADNEAAPAPATPGEAAGEGEPADAALEEQLAELWCEVLGREGVGRTDDFFALGGHSLLAAQLASRIQSALGRTLPLRTAFELPTVAGQAAFLARDENVRLPPLAAGAFNELSLDQQHLWQLHAAGADGHFYNVTRAVRLDGALDPALLRIALHRLLQRHTVLRTGYTPGPDGPRALALAMTSDPLTVVDLAGQPDAERAQQEQRLLVQETRQRFELARDVPIRFLLIRRAADHHLLIVTAHHIAVDCWSLGLPFQELRRADDPWHAGILLRELLSAYEDVRLGRASSLPVLPIQFTDFAHWQNSRLRDGSFAAHAAYWRGQLADAPRALALPADFPRPPRASLAGARLEFALPADLAPALDRYRRAQRTTRLAPLLGAYAIALRRWSGQADLVIGMPIGNRAHPETQQMIGPAASALPLRLRVADDDRASALVRQVWRTLQQAVAHQDYPFAQIARDLAPLPADRAPVFQVRFALQQSPAQPLPASGLRAAPVKIDRGIAKFDLSLVLAEQGPQLRGWCEYNGDLFKPETAAAFAASFVAVASRLFQGPDVRVAELLAADGGAP